jgi:2-polyprenyl-3-methyl-5-hydroxy-6-metoxy-1,4-benzoquinol methylase
LAFANIYFFNFIVDSFSWRSRVCYVSIYLQYILTYNIIKPIEKKSFNLNLKNFFKKDYKLFDGIYKFEISNKSTDLIRKFYSRAPFPNYKSTDDKYSILQNGNNNYLAKKFKKEAGHNKNILEVGSGTCQLSNYLAIGTNNNIFALDGTLDSLLIGREFSKKNNVSNIVFVNADLFDDVLPDNFFDFIWCNGVLHHTTKPSEGFKNLVKKLNRNGIILIGLYNKYGRIRTLIRKYIYRILGKKYLLLFDPILRSLTKEYQKNFNKIDSWINDQYKHPIESMHSYGECMEWINNNNLEYVNCIPNLNINLDYDLFKKSTMPNFFERFFIQLSMPFRSYGAEGGLFIIIAKKK